MTNKKSIKKKTFSLANLKSRIANNKDIIVIIIIKILLWKSRFR